MQTHNTKLVILLALIGCITVCSCSKHEEQNKNVLSQDTNVQAGLKETIKVQADLTNKKEAEDGEQTDSKKTESNSQADTFNNQQPPPPTLSKRSSTTSKLHSSDLKSKLAQLKFMAQRELAWAQAAVNNIEGYLDGKRRFEQQARMWNVYTKIPWEPQTDKLVAELTQAASKAGFKLLEPNVVEVKGNKSRVPERISEGKSFDYKDSDIRGIVIASFYLDRIDLSALENWLQQVKKIQRLALVRRVRAIKGKFFVNVEAYYFKRIDPPKVEVRPRSVEQLAKRIGISRSLAEIATLDRWGYMYATRTALEQFNALVPKLTKALSILQHNKLEGARQAFFRRKSEQIMGRTVKDVF